MENTKPCTREEAATIILASREYEGEQSVFFSPVVFQKEWLTSILYACDVYSNPKESVNKACVKGDVAFLRILLLDGYPVTYYAFVLALRCKQMDCLETLLEYSSPIYMSFISRIAIKYGKPVLSVMIDHGPALTLFNGSCMTLDCVRDGNLECLRYLIDRGAYINDICCEYAILDGRVDILRVLLDHGAYTSDDICRYAFENENMECLRLFVERRVNDYKEYEHLFKE